MNRSMILFAALLLSPCGPVIVAQASISPAEYRDAYAPDAATAQHEVVYADHCRIFTDRGEPASLDDIVRAMSGIDVVLIGESHTDPVGHWIEVELLRLALASARTGADTGATRPVALSLEMFERDVQNVVDEYLDDLITEDQFKADSRPWTHYDADYRPLVELAKEAGIPVIAANAPRRYVNRVTRLGREAVEDLSPRARAFLPPLPYPQPSDRYRDEWLTLMAETPMQRQCPLPAADSAMPGHAVVDTQAVAPHHVPPADSQSDPAPSHMESFMENGLHAQALWDASMAHAITTFLDTHPEALVLHMVGGFHVENHTGIPEQIQHYRPGTHSLVVSMDLAADFRSFDPEEHAGQGDFVILTDKSLDLEYARYCTGDGSG